MKITRYCLLIVLFFAINKAHAQCDIGTTGVAVVNANNTASVSSGCVGQSFNFKFTIANFGSSPGCVMPANTVRATFDFPTISGGIKPYIYNGPSSFVSGFFTWTYDAFFEQLTAINTTAIGFGEGDADILVPIIGNAAGTASSPLNLIPGPNSNNTNNDFASAQLIINALPTVTWSNTLTNQCANSTTYALTGGSPAGGTYSGAGVSGSNFNAVLAGTGPHTLTYTFTNGSGCTNFTTNTITVFALPTVSAGSYGPVCSNAAAVALGGSPSGGTWSGTGVTGNNFNPAVGTQTLTYTYTDVNGCSNSSTTTITVNTAPVVTTGSYGPVCSNAAAVSLAGSPSGGTWSGTGVTGNSFDPSAGTQTLTYTFSNGTCSNSASTTITVNPAPVVTAGSYGPVCSNASPVTLGGSPSGGTWSGTGVTGNSFDPSVGTQTLTYTFNNGTCSNSASTTITVNTAPVVITGSYGPVCSNASDITLTGSPAGGTWSGTGVTGNTFDPSAGTQTLTYTFSDGTCSNSASTTVTVNTAPSVSFTGLASTYCTTDAPTTLTGNPVGGTFSGPGISGNTFDPAVAGEGMHVIVYSFTNGSCTGSTSQVVTVSTCATFATLDLTVFLEGFYMGGSTMRSTLFDLSMSGDPTATDIITVNLWSPSNLSNPNPDYTLTTILHNDGTATMQFPAAVNGSSWYIAVKHRNSIETWSRNAIPFGPTNSYDFSTGLIKAYEDGINPSMSDMGGSVFAIYGGDVTQDGAVDGQDANEVEIYTDLGAFGYDSSDATGDGATDGLDANIIEINNNKGIFFARPM